MKRSKCKILITGLALTLTTFLVMVSVASALMVELLPSNFQRENGGRARVHVIANTDGGEDLISFGVKVTFNPAVLQADPAATAKNTDFNTGFQMDEDGIEGGTNYTTPDITIDNAGGSVTMLGGRLTGSSTTGLTGQVLLGWITFNVISLGDSNLTIDFFEPSTTFANFVSLTGASYDTTLTMTDGTACVRSPAREGDINANGVVLFDDYSLLLTSWGASAGDANYNPAADLDGDGLILFSDYAMLLNDWNQAVLSCP